jgi:predicted nucleotidyltransferase
MMHERRKVLKGILLFRDMRVRYLLRCIPLQDEYPERYGEARHLDKGPIKLEAKVIEDRYGFLLPTRYSIQVLKDGFKIDVVSYGGVICEQAKNGERVLVSGKLDERTEIGSGKKYSEIVVDMRGHYFYNPDFSKNL